MPIRSFLSWMASSPIKARARERVRASLRLFCSPISLCIFALIMSPYRALPLAGKQQQPRVGGLRPTLFLPSKADTGLSLRSSPLVPPCIRRGRRLVLLPLLDAGSPADPEMPCQARRDDQFFFSLNCLYNRTVADGRCAGPCWLA